MIYDCRITIDDWEMCVRKENEPLVAFWFRQLVEKPTPFIALCCMGAVCYLYSDLQGQNHRAEEIQLKTAEALAGVTAQMQIINSQLADLKAFHREERKK